MRQADLTLAATQAYRCLVKLGIRGLPVRPLAILRRCRHIAVYTYQQAAEQLDMTEEVFQRSFAEADAFTFRQGSHYVVCYREGGNPARLNFTLAHELGHILLHHQENNAAEDAEANCFARHLLCPVPATSGMTAEEMAVRCYVSQAAARKVIDTQRERVDMSLLAQVACQFANGDVSEQNSDHDA